MNIEKTSNLSFYNEQGILTLTAKQFDTGRMFVFHIMHNDAPFDLSGCTAYLRISKADGTQFQGHECCTIEGSKVIIKTNTGNGSQILTAAGTNVCELHLEDSDGISLTTWTFHIVVEPRVHDGSNMSSIDSYDVLDNMINMEKDRIASEEQRKENELQRKENEANRNTVFEEKIGETNAVITNCRLVIDTANQKINNFNAEINEIVDGITDEAQSYADNAKEAETNAANAASNATDSAATALQKAGDAAASAVLSQSYAVGGTGTREGEDADNAKEYAKQAKASADELREECVLKTEKGAAEGVATLDGDGKIPEGQLPDNIGSVTGVKGDKESAYRTGDVNLNAENIGAAEKDYEGYIINANGIKGNGREVDIIVNPEKRTGVIFYDNAILPLTPHFCWLGNFYNPFATMVSSAIEFITPTDSHHGGVIDFHFNGEQDKDFTSRIIESSKGVITFDFGDSSTKPINIDQNNGGFIYSWGNTWGLGAPNAPFHDLHLYQKTKDVDEYDLEFRVRTDIPHMLWKEPAITLETWDQNEYLTYTASLNGESLNFKNSDLGDDYTITYSNCGINIKGEDNNLLLNAAHGVVCLYSNGINVSFWGNRENGYFKPGVNAVIDMGSATHRWKNIYASNGVIQTSDRNEKNAIKELSVEKAQQLIYGLKPSTYKMNAGTSGRTHWGMISQDIEELFDEIGMTSLDFAGFIKSPKMHIEEEECDEKGKITKERVEEVIEGEYDYSLRYDEFIAPIIKVIQTQHEEIETLTKRIDFLEQQINNC